MTDLISKDTFDHLVDLAALELDASESEYLLQQLNNQLKAIRELEAIPLEEDILVTSHGVPYTSLTSPAPRLDKVIPSGMAEAILSQTPQNEDGYIIVPDIPHTTLK